MKPKQQSSLLFTLVAFLVTTLACGPSADATPTAPVAPPDSPPSQGRCGDGICDGPENAQNCPQDCSPGAAPPEAPTDSRSGRARLKPLWQSSLGACPGKQIDDFFAEMEFSWSVAEDGSLSGTGEGSMYAESVARCPDTDYGGVRTPEPFPVVVTGSVVETGWRIELVATDASQYYFNNGEVYHQGCILCWVLPEFKGRELGGTLASFTLPGDIQVGDQFTFDLDYHIPQGSYTNDHVGSGTLEILEVSR